MQAKDASRKFVDLAGVLVVTSLDSILKVLVKEIASVSNRRDCFQDVIA